NHSNDDGRNYAFIHASIANQGQAYLEKLRRRELFMRILNVAEKPSMAKQLSSILSGDDMDSNATMVMTSVLGHIKGLDFGPEYSDWQRVPVEELFRVPVISEVSSNMKDVAENLRLEARKSQVLIIWTDCDREGEYIGAEISEICRQANSRLDVYRARYSVLSSHELDRSMRSLSRLDMRQVSAAELRSELDLRGGAAFTRLQTLNFRIQAELRDKVISYGSCQFPTLGFIVEQYLRLIRRPLPLRTVELQKMGARYLKLSSDKIMEIAEKLYNQGLISYPRTETDMFESSFDLHSLISRQKNSPKWGSYAESLSNGKFKFPKAGKNNDKAHPPIHPTKDGSSLTGAEAKVYEFVTRRFLACCSEDAKGLETVVLASIGDEEFRARGVMVRELNYLQVYIYENWNDQAIDNFAVGDQLEPSRLEMTMSTTVAPKLLSEPELIGSMDKNGIGTDATIHEHIKKIIERQYVIKNSESRFHPTNLGLSLVVGYDQIGLEESLTKPKLRASLEHDLGEICEGRKTKHQVLSEMLQLFQNSLSATLNNIDVLYRTLEENRRSGLLEPAPLDNAESFSRGGGGGSRDGSDRGRGGGGGGRGDNDGGGDDDNGNSGGGGGRTRDNVTIGNGMRNNVPISTGMNNNIPVSIGTRNNAPISIGTNNRVPVSIGTRNSALISNGMRNNVPAGDGPECGCRKPSTRRITKKEGPNFGRAFWSCGDCNYFCWTEDVRAGGLVRETCTFNNATVNCNCGKEAVMRTVTRDGPNQGRPFAVCASPKEASCSFFAWQDQEAAAPTRPVSKFDHKVQCDCGMVAVREETRNGPNKGRVYLRCSKTVKKCRFFEWEDGNSTNSEFTITCYKCGQAGHFANACTLAEATDMDAAPRSRGRGRGRGRGSYKRRKTTDD
ncbi:DNA topoisomerase, partial [Paramicrosporidium saccamoebae]